MITKRCGFHKWITVSRKMVYGVILLEKECIICRITKHATEKPKKFTPLKKKPIRGVSVKMRSMLAQYRALKREANPLQACANCGKVFNKGELDAHHTHGRIGDRILRFVWICPSLHKRIHAQAKLAREVGWLAPEFDGRPSTDGTPAPWARITDKRIAHGMGFTCE